MFAGLKHALNALKTNWSEDPAARGAAKMAAGAFLIVEGLFGLLRSGGESSDGKRQLGGLLGGIFAVIAGAIFVFLGNFIEPEVPADAVYATGIIVERERVRSREGGTTYSAVIEFQTESGKTQRFTESASSSVIPTKGKKVDVTYSRDDPGYAFRTDGLGAQLPTIVWGVGIFLIISAIFSIIISAAIIIFGVILFRQGRQERLNSGTTGGFFTDLVSLAKGIRKGEVETPDLASTAQQT